MLLLLCQTLTAWPWLLGMDFYNPTWWATTNRQVRACNLWYMSCKRYDIYKLHISILATNIKKCGFGSGASICYTSRKIAFLHSNKQTNELTPLLTKKTTCKADENDMCEQKCWDACVWHSTNCVHPERTTGKRRWTPTLSTTDKRVRWDLVTSTRLVCACIHMRM